MEQYIIYKVQHKQTKQIIYVGQTKRNLNRRKSEHLSHKESPIHDLLNENSTIWEFKAIDFANNKKESFQKETFWTEFLSKFHSLKNVGIGANSMAKTSKEIMIKRWECSLGEYYKTHEHRKGFKLSQEQIEKLRVINTGKEITQDQR